MTDIRVYHVIGGVLVRKGRPAITPPTAPGERPTGTGYVRYEDLYVSGNSLRTVLGKVTGGKVLTFPEGEFQFSDFADPIGYFEGIRVPTACGGIWGSGRNTIFSMVPNSSTVGGDPEAVPPTSGANQAFLMGAWHSNVVFKNFQLKGTPQGHYHNGLRVTGASNAKINDFTIESVFFNGCNPGYMNYPPGETMAFGTNHANNVRLVRCEFDGRDPISRARTCASPFGWNNSVNAYVEDVYAHHSLTGMPTFYQTDGIHTVRLRSEYNGSGSGQLSGSGINHENCSGTVLHESPTLIIDRAAGNSGLHMSLFNGIADQTDVTLTNVTHDAGPTNGAFSVAMYANYVDPQGRTMKQVTPPTITKGGVTLLPRQYTDSGIDAAQHFVHY